MKFRNLNSRTKIPAQPFGHVLRFNNFHSCLNAAYAQTCKITNIWSHLRSVNLGLWMDELSAPQPLNPEFRVIFTYQPSLLSSVHFKKE